VRIAAINGEGGRRAEEMIRAITEDPEVGRVYQGKVRSVVTFGAFVEIVPGRDGLLHISEIEHHRVGRVEDVLNVGDLVMVKVIGVDRDGAFAEYVAMPAGNAWKLDATIPREVAAIMDPLGNAVHAALEDSLAAKAVAVIGCGPIGLMAIPVCHMAGAAMVVATDVSDHRLALARRMGADLVLDAKTEDVPARIREATAGQGVDVVLEMSGHPKGLRDGLGALRKGGWVSLLGLPSGEVAVDIADQVIFKEARLVGIFGRRMWRTWEQATALLNKGLDVTPIITHRLPLDRFEEAFALLKTGSAGKVILYV